MGLVSRGAAMAAALTAGALTACGGSLADADAPGPTRSAAAPASPFCAAAQANSDALGPLSTLVSRGDAPPAALSSTAETVRRAGNDLLAAAPGEIRTDVERAVQAVNLQLDALLANGGDRTAMARDPDLAARLDSPELAAAIERYRSYVVRTCGGGTARR
jgi:hypothetical protein